MVNQTGIRLSQVVKIAGRVRLIGGSLIAGARVNRKIGINVMAFGQRESREQGFRSVAERIIGASKT